VVVSTGVVGDTVLLDLLLALVLVCNLARTRPGSRGLMPPHIHIDDCKRVNDSHGHATGDEPLRLFATRLRGGVRDVETAWAATNSLSCWAMPTPRRR
jgi:PleD family two-component response regulator